MTAVAESLLEQVLALPDAERDEFVALLHELLPERAEPPLSGEWMSEIGSRVKQLRSGEVIAEDWEVARDRLCAEFPEA